MFQAPTRENKHSGDAMRTRPEPEPGRKALSHSGAVPARAATLQRSLGNQAVLRMLDQQRQNPPAALQAKLVVGPSNDPLEQEADRVAAQVMRMPDTEPAVTAAQPQLSRKCAACEEEDAEKLQTKPAGTSEAAAQAAPTIVHEVLRSPGQPLAAPARDFFEPRFGRDFSDVRVHADTQAAESARAVNALAYTVGRDIVFGQAAYDPRGLAGKSLLAHELAHVAQQGGSQEPALRRQTEGEETVADSADNGQTSEEEVGNDAETLDVPAKGACGGSKTLNFQIKNFRDLDFTVPKGCKATVDCEALWVPSGEGGVDCCTGKDTYDITLNSVSHSLQAGPNVCGDEAAHQPVKGSFEVKGGRQRGKITVSRSGCEGVALSLKITVRIHK